MTPTRSRCAWCAAFVVLCGLSLASKAHAQRAINNQTQPLPTQRVSIPATLNFFVGQGSFVSDKYARNPYAAWQLDLLPGFTFKSNTTLLAYLGFSQELTESDSDTYRRQVLFSDTALMALHPLWTAPGTKTSFMGDVLALFGTSKVSRSQTMRTALRARIWINQPWKKLLLRYRGSFRKNFHSQQTADFSKLYQDRPSPFVEGDSSRPVDRTLWTAQQGFDNDRNRFLIAGGNNESFRFTNRLQVIWFPIPKLMVSAEYILANGYTYASYPKDELSGQGAKAGRGRRTAQTGTLDATYFFLPSLMLSAGMSTSGPVRRADGRGVRFPFFDFQSEANNLTVFYTALTYSYSKSIPGKAPAQ